jgi:ribonuclease VapC
MVVDSSAIVAIALLEPNWRELSAKAIGSQAIVAAPTLLETHMVLRSRLGDDADRALSTVVTSLNIQVVPFGPEHLREACLAFDQYGKSRHRAALNFGDCVSYALSKVSGQPLLYVGDDFAETNLRPA